MLALCRQDESRAGHPGMGGHAFGNPELAGAEVCLNPFLTRAVEPGIGYLVVVFDTLAPKRAPSVFYAATRGWADEFNSR